MANNYQSPFDFLKTFGKLWSEKQEKKKEEQKALTFNEMANYYLSTKKQQPESPELTTLPPTTGGMEVPGQLGEQFMPFGEGRPEIQERGQPPATMAEFDWAETQRFINAANLLGSNYGAAAQNLAGLKMRDWERKYGEQEDISEKAAKEAKELETRKLTLIDNLTNDLQAGKITKDEYDHQVEYVNEYGRLDYGRMKQVPGVMSIEEFESKHYKRIIPDDMPAAYESYKAGKGISQYFRPIELIYQDFAYKYRNDIEPKNLQKAWEYYQNGDWNKFDKLLISPVKPVKVGLTPTQIVAQQTLSKELRLELQDIEAKLRTVKTKISSIPSKYVDDIAVLNKEKADLEAKWKKVNAEKVKVDEDYPGYLDDKKEEKPEMTEQEAVNLLQGILNQ